MAKTPTPDIKDDFDPDRGKTRAQIFWRDNRDMISIMAYGAGLPLAFMTAYCDNVLLRILGGVAAFLCFSAPALMPTFLPPRRTPKKPDTTPSILPKGIDPFAKPSANPLGGAVDFITDTLDPSMRYDKSGYIAYQPDMFLKDTNEYWGSELIFTRDPNNLRDASGEYKKDAWVENELKKHKDGTFFEAKPAPGIKPRSSVPEVKE